MLAVVNSDKKIRNIFFSL